MQMELSVCLASLTECVLQFIDVVVGQKVMTTHCVWAPLLLSAHLSADTWVAPTFGNWE